MDPFNSKNNIGGKNIKTKGMQTMFRSIYYFMNQQIATPYLPQLFELNLLFLWKLCTNSNEKLDFFIVMASFYENYKWLDKFKTK